MSSKPIRDKMAALSISENPLGSQLFKICEGFSKSQPQQTGKYTYTYKSNHVSN